MRFPISRTTQLAVICDCRPLDDGTGVAISRLLLGKYFQLQPPMTSRLFDFYDGKCKVLSKIPSVPVVTNKIHALRIQSKDTRELS